jgi:serine/threonine-protein kinase HipA
MALKLNVKDDRLGQQDFLALARTIGLAAGEADAALADLARRLSERAAMLTLPESAGGSEVARAVRDKVIAILTDRLVPFGR